MEKILECLTDPSWWFTAVIVAFLMSLFAAIVHRPLLRLIASRSARVGAWLAEKDRRLDERVDVMMKDPTRILVTYLQLIVGLCLTAVT